MKINKSNPTIYNPLVTIGVPVYGVESYIERCANSIFSQTYDNLEILFVDDNTQDNSIPIIVNALDKFPQRKQQIRIIKHQKNRGLAAARNTVLENMSGEFISWVDADDWLDCNAIEQAVYEQKKGDYDIVTFDAIFHYKNGRSIKYKYPNINNSHELCVHTIVSDYRIWGRLIRTHLYKSHNIKPLEGANLGEDYQQTPILLFYSNKVQTLNNIFYHYECSNITSYTKSGQSTEKQRQLEESRSIVEVFFKEKGQEFEKALQTSKVIQSLEKVVEWNNVTKKDIQLLNCNKQYSKNFHIFIRPFFYLNLFFAHMYCSIYNNVKRYTGFTK